MNVIFPRQFSLLLGLSALAVVGGGVSAQAQTTNSIQPAPTPGTAATSAAAFNPAQTTPQPLESTAEPSTPNEVAQVEVLPGQATRGGSSYLGVGGNIGLGGDSALGDTSFAVFSKIGFTNALSLRPSVLISDDPTILIPITYDFSIQADPFTETFAFSPYVGGGIGITTGAGGEVGALLTGGVDLPISPQFTATAGVNLGFFDDVDVGLQVGIGYNFTTGF